MTGVVLEEAERAIKTVIEEDNLLPAHCRGLSPEEWGIELADYFECVSGERPACSNVGLPRKVALPCSSATSAGALDSNANCQLCAFIYANTGCMISVEHMYCTGAKNYIC